MDESRSSNKASISSEYEDLTRSLANSHKKVMLSSVADHTRQNSEDIMRSIVVRLRNMEGKPVVKPVRDLNFDNINSSSIPIPNLVPYAGMSSGSGNVHVHVIDGSSLDLSCSGSHTQSPLSSVPIVTDWTDEDSDLNLCTCVDNNVHTQASKGPKSASLIPITCGASDGTFNRL